MMSHVRVRGINVLLLNCHIENEIGLSYSMNGVCEK